MSDGKITFSTELDNKALAKELISVNTKIGKLNKSIAENRAKKLPLTQRTEELGAALDDANYKLERLQKQQALYAAAIAGGDPVLATDAFAGQKQVEADVRTQEKAVRRLQMEYDRAADKVDAYDAKIAAATDELGRCTRKAEELNASLSDKHLSLTPAIESAERAVQKFSKRIATLGKRVLVFSLITGAFRSIRDYMSKLLAQNDEYNSQLQQMRGAMMTAFQPIYTAVLPGLLAVMKVVTTIFNVIANVLSLLGGKTAKDSAKAAQSLNKEAKAIKGVGAAAKEANKDLATFDELNRLSDKDPVGGGGGGGLDIAVKKPDFDAFDTDEYQKKIDEITAIAGLAALEIGMILAFSGVNIPLGISLMAIGALGMWAEIAGNPEGVVEMLRGTIGQVTGMLALCSLVIGALLCFSGVNLPLGIALMASGAIGLAAIAALNWDKIEKTLRGPVGRVMALMSISLLVMGALLLFSGANIPLGAGLMIAGAAGLAGIAAINWDKVANAMDGTIGIITRMVSIALLCIGAVLTFSGASIPLGLSLLVAGAAGLVATQNVDWSTITNALQGPIGAITIVISGALLILGVCLLFSGVGIELGLGMILAGGVGLAATVAANWNFITEKVQGAWESVKRYFHSSIAPKLTIGYWEEKLSGIGEGLKAAMKSGINAAIGHVNTFIGWLNSRLSFSIPGINVAGKQLTQSTHITLANISDIPLLAKGAVIPPNAPFMAMLGDQRHGTNIEAPLETIQKAVALVMSDFIDSNMAGHEATVAILREILEAVLGIQIGDEVISHAVERYRQKMAIVQGG